MSQDDLRTQFDKWYDKEYPDVVGSIAGWSRALAWRAYSIAYKRGYYQGQKDATKSTS